MRVMILDAIEAEARAVAKVASSKYTFKINKTGEFGDSDYMSMALRYTGVDYTILVGNGTNF